VPDFDPAPAQLDVPAELYPVDYTPNEIEAGQSVFLDEPDSAAQAGAVLPQRVGTAIIKLGAQGAVCATKEETFQPFPVSAVDTVAAGDAFTGSSSCFGGRASTAGSVWELLGSLASTKPGAVFMCDRYVRCVSPTAIESIYCRLV